MKTLYIEMNSGVSGDMLVGALLDLTGGFELLKRKLSGLLPNEFSLSLTDVKKCGIAAKKFSVLTGDGSAHADSAEGAHHHHLHHHHHHRNLGDICNIINNAQLAEDEKALALKIAHTIARAEAAAHGVAMDEVHFHEVGAVDSIVDIVSAAVLLTAVGADRIFASPFCEGTGFAHCAHGEMPLPVPASANIIAECGGALLRCDSPKELTTPTGAAIVASVASFENQGAASISKIGIGAGDRDLERPNILRVFLSEDSGGTDRVCELSCNLDDCTGETLAYLADSLFEAGALDCFFTPIYMKKSRPAQLLCLLCAPSDRAKMAELIFRETTTIGMRVKLIDRIVMSRTAVKVQTIHGEIAGKRCEYGDILKIYPEYESARAAAKASGRPLVEIYDAFYRAAK